MHRNSYISNLTEIQVLAYILRSVSEGKNEDQIAERFDGDKRLVRTCLDALHQIHYIVKNYFDELVITSEGQSYLQHFNSHR
ncbi:MAG TPA: hypothetical protein VE130_06475 [Nitrososphaeraceae archaeon]|nr:hypothetical protein [Nitrososphaeraceae archaeon]